MSKELHKWFLINRREFPWRQSPTPYRVWVSEVMLQQTRASVVVPYFERWMALFPDVSTLALASLDAVIKAWEGLGYYSRARNLHRGAQQIVEKFGGEVPSRREDLESIHGLGPYTVGAILSFGFRKRAPAVDGNVTRVLSRYFLIEENVDKQSTKRKIFAAAESLLDQEEPWVTAEALIELGATICTPKPRCQECALRLTCLGQSKAELLPIKRGEKEVTKLMRSVVLIEWEEKILVKKGEKGKIMADLYEFPYFEMGSTHWSREMIVDAVYRTLKLKVKIIEKLPKVSHTFTRFKADLYPIKCESEVALPIDGFEWVHRDLLYKLPFSSGHRRIFS